MDAANAEIINAFIKNKKAKGLNSKTIANYQHSIAQFLAFYGQPVDNLNPEDVEDYALWLQEQPLKTSTINDRLRELRVFINFCKQRGWVDKEVTVSLVQENEPEIVPFSDEQLDAIYDACLSLGKAYNKAENYVQQRDYIIMRIMEETGMRIGEVLRLNILDVDIRGQTIRVRQAKNKEARATYFTQALAKEMKNYLEVRHDFLYDKRLTATSLFVSSRGTPVNVRTVQENIKEYGRLAGIVGVRVSPHTFRHTFAKTFLMNGGDISTLKEILGHKTLEMTMRYARLFGQQKQLQYHRVMGK